MKDKKGFTLMESVAVIIILSILATIALIHYSSARERVADKEVISNLKIIQAAEKAHMIDTGSYYPASGSESRILIINQNLQLLLDTNPQRHWNYTVFATGCSEATRNGGDSRTWFLTINDANDEPDPGNCPP